MTPDHFTRAQELVGARLGLDFSDRRGEVVQRRLARALQPGTPDGGPAALARLATLAPESPELLQFARHLTVGETYFFRDRACFQALEQRVLPDLIAARRAAKSLQLRVWSAGCSTGEEPYSLAILLDRLLPDAADWRLTILGTDINPDSLKRASAARYGDWSFRSTPGWVREQYFQRINATTYELVPHIRERVRFRPLNLAECGDPAVNRDISAMDLILCRNVLMYFTEAAQRATIERLQRSLVKSGWLAVAPSEASAALLAPLVPVNFPGSILFQKLPATKRSAPQEIATSPYVADPVIQELPPAKPAAALPACSREKTPLPRRARELANRGQVAEARDLCQTAVRQDSLDIEPLLLLATLSEECGDAAAAQEALRRALYLEPDSALAQFTLGALLLRQGQKARAKRLLGSAAQSLELLPSPTLVEHGDGITAGDLLGRALRWLETC